MLIEYESESVREIFNDFDLMQKEIGMDRASATKKRLDQLKAALNFSIYLTTGLGYKGGDGLSWQKKRLAYPVTLSFIREKR